MKFNEEQKQIIKKVLIFNKEAAEGLGSFVLDLYGIVVSRIIQSGELDEDSTFDAGILCAMLYASEERLPEARELRESIELVVFGEKLNVKEKIKL